MRRLMIVALTSIRRVFLMIFLAFGSIRSALMAIANLPFALVGGILAIYLLKIKLCVSAAIGFISL